MVPQRVTTILLTCSIWFVAFGSCTDSDIYAETLEPNLSNKVTVSGTVCTDDPTQRQFPVKIMFLVDNSGTMAENDPTGQRGKAMADIIQWYNASQNYSFAVSRFAGEVMQLTEGYTQRLDVLNEVEVWIANPDPCSDGWCRNWQAALSVANSVFSGDVLTSNPGQLTRTRYVFVFVVNGPPDPGLNDKAKEKQQLVTAIQDMLSFGKDHGVAEIAFHTIQIDDKPGTCQGLTDGTIRYCNSSTPCPPNCSGNEACQQPSRVCSQDHTQVCDTSADCAQSCDFIRVCSNDVDLTCTNDTACCPTYPCNDPQHAINDRTKDLLQAMAFAGRGEYQRYTLGGQLNFRTLDFQTTQSIFVKKAFMVHNLNAKTMCGKTLPDSDGDGLADREEECYGEILAGTCLDLNKCKCTLDVWSKDNQTGTDTNPIVADTDGDGLGDMLEMLFSTVNLDPLRTDLPEACFGLLRPYAGQDSDQDGLNDCEEKLIGTDPNLYDSDRDGYPDKVEFTAGANYLQADNLQDSDMDGIKNGTELEEHLDPSCNDSLSRSSEAYRYKIIDEGLRVVPFTSQPQRIYGIEVTNVSGRSTAGSGMFFYHPTGTRRDDGTIRDQPSLDWLNPGDGNPGLEVPITGSGEYVLYGACQCSSDCGGCNPGEWCNPATGICEADPCTFVSCSSTETCDPTLARCVVDCTKSECGAGQRCDPLLGRCLTDLCLNKQCPQGTQCDTEAGACAQSPCAAWQCPAGMQLIENQKPPWIKVWVDEPQLPQSGFWCDRADTEIDCTTEAQCPAGSACLMRESLNVGMANKNCISFKVKNITLVETLTTNPAYGPGYNNLFAFFAQTPLDNPYAYSIFRVALRSIRYYNDKKDPNIAEMPLDDSDFFPIDEK